ncbi:hypothetical protein ACUXAV_000364 [Cupriavidus metallidurans]|nr:hypothetical protein [Cupriavidus metallidurans]MDE4918324.1 hypothetical protein [Cupriavidus metallidurans]
MTSTAALVVLATAGAIFLAVGLYANYRLQKWMANYEEDPKE